jgi:hypothetical protein
MFAGEFDVEINARNRIDSSLGDLVLLRVSERFAFLLLAAEGDGEQEAERDGSDRANLSIPSALLF